MSILENTMCYIDWVYLSENSAAIDFLTANPIAIDVESLCSNPNGIPLLLEYGDINNYDWDGISMNPSAIDIIEANMDKFVYTFGSSNPSIFTYDYAQLKKNKHNLHECLIEELFHPKRILKHLSINTEIEDYLP